MAMRCAGAVLAIAMVWAVPGQACTMHRDAEAERANWIELNGSYEERSTIVERKSDDLTVCISAERCDLVEDALRWTETTHHGRVIASDGAHYTTKHKTSDTKTPPGCAPVLPERSAQGVFYLELDPDGGGYVIKDWIGRYNEEPHTDGS